MKETDFGRICSTFGGNIGNLHEERGQKQEEVISCIVSMYFIV
jgi:hypothetical protein